MVEGRWIRARIFVKDKTGDTLIFADVGPDELKKIINKYYKCKIFMKTEDDWGRYLNPRTEQDKKDKEEIKKLLEDRKCQ